MVLAVAVSLSTVQAGHGGHGGRSGWDKASESIFALAGPAMAQAPTLTSSAFYGGAGDQRGTAIAVGGGGLYISSNVQPETQSTSDTALVLRYALPSGPSPIWARSYDFGTDFFGIAATNEGVYADGWNYSLTTDNVGDKEVKSILAKFAPDGSNGAAFGGAIWLGLPHFFAYTGVEILQAATTAVEGGSPVIYAVGGGQPCSFFAYVITKFDASGNLLAKATDPGQENAFNDCFYNGTGSSGSGVAVLDGNIYAVGSRGGFPTIWKHAPDLSVVWRRQGIASGQFLGVAGFGGDIYAVGSIPDNAGDFLIQKYDEAGTLLWSQTSGGANEDVLTGVVATGTRLFAVGYTRSSGAGGADSVVLEIDPATGATLSTTLFGGTLDDKANGAANDGTDLYVVGESRSFASAKGNTVGQNDVMLLRYTFGPTYAAQVQHPINADESSVFSVKRGVVPVKFTLTFDGVATCNLPPATISLMRTAGGVVGGIDESTYLSASDKGSNFRISNCHYHYNLATSSLGPGTYKVNISIGGIVVGSGTFALK
jgi:hypothetical protein